MIVHTNIHSRWLIVLRPIDGVFCETGGDGPSIHGREAHPHGCPRHWCFISHSHISMNTLTQCHILTHSLHTQVMHTHTFTQIEYHLTLSNFLFVSIWLRSLHTLPFSQHSPQDWRRSGHFYSTEKSSVKRKAPPHPPSSILEPDTSALNFYIRMSSKSTSPKGCWLTLKLHFRGIRRRRSIFRIRSTRTPSWCTTSWWSEVGRDELFKFDCIHFIVEFLIISMNRTTFKFFKCLNQFQSHPLSPLQAAPSTCAALPAASQRTSAKLFCVRLWNAETWQWRRRRGYREKWWKMEGIMWRLGREREREEGREKRRIGEVME